MEQESTDAESTQQENIGASFSPAPSSLAAPAVEEDMEEEEEDNREGWAKSTGNENGMSDVPSRSTCSGGGLGAVSSGGTDAHANTNAGTDSNTGVVGTGTDRDTVGDTADTGPSAGVPPGATGGQDEVRQEYVSPGFISEGDEEDDSGDDGGGHPSSGSPAKEMTKSSAAAGDGEGGDGGKSAPKESSCRRAKLPDHVPEVDDRKRPWLWNAPAYLFDDPERFGACYGEGELEEEERKEEERMAEERKEEARRKEEEENRKEENKEEEKKEKEQRNEEEKQQGAETNKGEDRMDEGEKDEEKAKEEEEDGALLDGEDVPMGDVIDSGAAAALSQQGAETNEGGDRMGEEEKDEGKAKEGGEDGALFGGEDVPMGDVIDSGAAAALPGSTPGLTRDENSGGVAGTGDGGGSGTGGGEGGGDGGGDGGDRGGGVGCAAATTAASATAAASAAAADVAGAFADFAAVAGAAAALAVAGDGDGGDGDDGGIPTAVGAERMMNASKAGDTSAVDPTLGSLLQESPPARELSGAVSGASGGPGSSVTIASEEVGAAVADCQMAAIEVDEDTEGQPCGDKESTAQTDTNVTDEAEQRDVNVTKEGAKGEKDVAEVWAGLCLDGLKGSARWPIRKERLMSADFLAETGVLPKVGRVHVVFEFLGCAWRVLRCCRDGDVLILALECLLV